MFKEHSKKTCRWQHPSAMLQPSATAQTKAFCFFSAKKKAFAFLLRVLHIPNWPVSHPARGQTQVTHQSRILACLAFLVRQAQQIRRMHCHHHLTALERNGTAALARDGDGAAQHGTRGG